MYWCNMSYFMLNSTWSENWIWCWNKLFSARVVCHVITLIWPSLSYSTEFYYIRLIKLYIIWLLMVDLIYEHAIVIYWWLKDHTHMLHMKIFVSPLWFGNKTKRKNKTKTSNQTNEKVKKKRKKTYSAIVIISRYEANNIHSRPSLLHIYK